MNTKKTILKEKNNRTAGRLFALFLAALAISAAPAPHLCALAADAPVAEAEDPEDAVKGHVYIRAALQEGYSPIIHVELLPETEGCVSHSYVLDTENGYGVSDDIAEGTYGCICYVDESSTWKYDIQAVYGGEEQEVIKENDDPPCYLIVAGSPEFAEGNSWLSTYRDQDGRYVDGTVTGEMITEIKKRMIASQDTEEDGEPIPDNPPEEYTDPSIPAEEEDGEPAVEEPGQGQDEEEKGRPHTGAFLLGGAAAVLAAAVWYAVIRRRKQKKGGSAG